MGLISRVSSRTYRGLNLSYAMKVIISGGGLAGLSVAKLLAKSPKVTSIKICQPLANRPSPVLPLQSGLWTPAMKVLKNDLGIDVRSGFASVEGSGYRSTSGAWLLRPHTPLAIFPDAEVSQTPSQSFVDNSELMARIAAVSSNQDSSKKIRTACGRVEHFDLLIAADGTLSQTKINLRVDLNLQHQGYTVYRGHSALDLQESFQTLGLGCRFAAVPAGGGGCNWFLANSVNDFMLTKFSNIKDNKLHGHSFGNLSRVVDYQDDVKKNIGKLLQPWHQPIDEILQQTDS